MRLGTCAALGCLIALPHLGMAQGFESVADCMFDSTTAALPAGGSTIDTTGTFGALIIFARFADGADVDSSGAALPTCICGDEWTVTSANVPDWADSLIDSSAATRRPGSLTDFFYTWSQGKHTLKGAVLDTVVVLDSTVAYYDTAFGGNALYRANDDVLAKAEQLIDMSQFDVFGDDNRLDHVFIQYHSTAAFYAADSSFHRIAPGASAVARIVEPGGTPYVTAQGDTVCCGATLWQINHKGTVYRNRWLFLNAMAHEYGHALRFLVGIKGGHLSNAGRYSIMQGDFPTALLMHGEVRRQLNWINPPVIRRSDLSADTTTIVLSASYLDGDGTFAIIEPDTSLLGHGNILPYDKRVPQFFLLEARRTGLPGEAYSIAQPPGCCRPTMPGGSGLLVTHVADFSVYNTEGWGSWLGAVGAGGVPAIDIEVADGAFDTTSAAPDSKLGVNLLRWTTQFKGVGGLQGWGADLFIDQKTGGPTRVNAFTPYSNPNTNLYENEQGGVPDWHQTIYSGISIHDVEWTSAARESIRAKIHFGPIAGPAAADTIRVDTTWRGLVQLDGDVVVDSSVTVTVAQDAMVVAKAVSDRFRAGVDTSAVEIRVLGHLQVAGADSVVRFTSSRDDDFVHWGKAGVATEQGEDAAPNVSDWYGLSFDNLVATRAGYGYTGVVEAMSEVKDAEFRYGEVGIAMEGQAAPSISGVSFTSINSDKHIFLDKTDVFVPHAVRYDSCDWDTCWTPTETVWNLSGGTHIVATNTIVGANDANIGITGKVDLIVGGKLFTSGSAASGDTVYFRPETATAAADDWGGIIIDNGYSKGGAIEYADIGYADNPLFVFYPDSLWALRHSRIHHFAGTGIWVDGAVGQGGVIESNTIERGATLDVELGRRGILLDEADEMRILANKIDLSGLQIQGSTSYPVHAYFGPWYCGIPAVESDSLVFDGNWIIGPGVRPLVGNHSGIYLDYLCGGSKRRIHVKNNYIDGLNVAGLSFRESAGIQVDCNTILNGLRAVDITRDSTTTGGTMRFWKNWLEVKSSSGFEAVRTDNRGKTALGMAAPLTDRGNNGLMAEDALVEFVLSNDPSGVDSLHPAMDARSNYWYTYNTSTQAEELLNTQFEVSFKLKLKLKPSSAHVDYSGYYKSDSTAAYCRQESSPGVGRAYAGTQEGTAEPLEREPFPSGLLSNGLPPAETFVDPPAPSPSRGAVVLSLGVAAGADGVFVLEVFDVTGRRVRKVLDGPLAPGRYRIGWRGNDEAGRSVSSGIYFVRLRGPGFVRTEKVTIVR